MFVLRLSVSVQMAKIYWGEAGGCLEFEKKSKINMWRIKDEFLTNPNDIVNQFNLITFFYCTYYPI